jgi:ribosomal protein S1
MNAEMITFTAGTVVTVSLKDGTTVTGEFISVNSKGVNIKVDGKTTSRGLGRVTSVEPAHADTPADLFADGDEYTTAELAAAFDMTTRALRIELRKLGVGVGKGHTYKFSATQARGLYGSLNAK